MLFRSNTSSPPSSRTINPKPLFGLNHLTVPLVIFSFHDKLAAEELRLLKRCDVEEEISIAAKKAAQSKTAARALGHTTLKAKKNKQKSEKLFLILAHKKKPKGKPALLVYPCVQ